MDKGEGALREALEHTAKLFHRYCAYVSHTSPHAGVTFEDCLEVECVENRRVLALSLSSPIEPGPVDFSTWFCKAHLPTWNHREGTCFVCNGLALAAAPTPQASEIRAARVAALNEAIDAINSVRFVFQRSSWADALEKVMELRDRALAPSRQGAG